MKTKHHISIKNVLESLSGLYVFLIGIGLFFVVLWITVGLTSNLIPFFLFFLGLGLVPNLILLFEHYFYNKDLIFNIDSVKEQYIIQRKSNSYQYPFNELLSKRLFKTPYPDFLGRLGTLITWTGFKVLRLEFKNGDVHYLSSLILNDGSMPFNNLKTYSTWFPLIESIKDSGDLNYVNNAKYYLKKFEKKSIYELNQIIENKDSYTDEALNAARKLLVSCHIYFDG